MRLTVRPALVAGALAAFAAAACSDVPFAPRWDADWYVPLPSQKIVLLDAFQTPVVPAGTSANVSFDAQPQQLDASIGAILQRDLRSASLKLTLTKSVAISGTDTLFVASSRPNLTNGDPTTIVVPMSFAAADTQVDSTRAVSQAGLSMLQTRAQAQDSLFVQLRGRATYPGPGTLIITATDSIGIRLALIARIGVSTR
ncbi:MAG: hypothetical protein AABY85_05550 [Gemmatimonadota bacterium]|jgi:hypothetical protein